MLRYRERQGVEQLFRSTKSRLATRPTFHKCAATIRGHVFCSFLALVLGTELQDRLEPAPRPAVEDHLHRLSQPGAHGF